MPCRAAMLLKELPAHRVCDERSVGWCDGTACAAVLLSLGMLFLAGCELLSLKAVSTPCNGNKV